MLRTKSGLPKYCSWNLDREGGQRRVRFRKAGFAIYLTGIPWSEDFMRQHAKALEFINNKQVSDIGAERTIPGSFDALCVSYYRSAAFRDLAEISQRNRRNIIERIRAEPGKNPIKLLTRNHVARMIEDRADTPQAANVFLKTLRVILNHAVNTNMIPNNPALGVKGYRSKGDGVHTWTEDEVAQFEVRHPECSKARLALYLLLFTAQRKADVARMGWQHVRGDMIAVRQQKTDTPLLIQLHPKLARALASTTRNNLTFLLTERGSRPFTPGGFGMWFRKRCNEADLRQCSAHGLRKLAATRLAEAGCTNAEIKAITGHRADSEVNRYTTAANQQRLARQALNRQLVAESGTGIVQQSIPAGQKS
jgi:integrase